MTLFFRIKDNGATVFRREEDPRQRRLDLNPIAEANVRNGAIKPRGAAKLSDGETAEIEAWIETRRATLAGREAATPETAVEALNAAAHWISGKPDPAIADAWEDALLIAMHDLRTAIVRRKADMATKA